MLRQELARFEAAGELERSAVDALELSLRRFVERGERPEHHEEIRETLLRVRERMESLLTELAVEPDLRQSAQAVVRLIDRTLRAVEFAGRLRELRAQKGLSVERLADLAGINVSILYRLERGGFAPPSRRTLQRLAQALQVGLDDLAPVHRKVAEPARVEEAVAFSVRLEELRREERALLFELVDWWAVRRGRYALIGPVASGQERTLDLVREMVRVLAADSEEVRALRWAILERVARANGKELRQLAGCTASASAGEQEKVPPGQGSDFSGYRGGDALKKRCDPEQDHASHPFPSRTRK